MAVSTFAPSDILKRYVRCYWLCTTEEDVSMEVMFPSGHIEFCIDISNGKTIRHRGGHSMKTPHMEILGHCTKPTQATVAKGTTLLIVRFHPYAFSLFFSQPASDFTNYSVDVVDLINHESEEFYDRLLAQSSLSKKIETLENFLVQRLARGNKNPEQFKLTESLCHSISKGEGSFKLKEMVSGSGYSERYIEKVFLNWVGVTPKGFQSVRRFNNSLELIQTSKASLTSIALECGYYDQAHFIKAFKSYSGMTPSQAATFLLS